ncbi:uncharacterized protein PRCAT00002386001 [Priceomyces carsonii]|uniref:uncharacterized protein n=1 Tax=Priceomyces carsonii TaxID=28549 RepID=UPI002EDBACDC|nr:unnamed protein product [Priceomyces carsonii]
MYQQPNGSYHSTESLRRLSSNNPFRKFTESQQSSTSRSGTPTKFEEWVSKNKKLAEASSDEDDGDYSGFRIDDYNASDSPLNERFSKPQPPSRPQRTGSDSSVNYGER